MLCTLQKKAPHPTNLKVTFAKLWYFLPKLSLYLRKKEFNPCDRPDFCE